MAVEEEEEVEVKVEDDIDDDDAAFDVAVDGAAIG